MTRTPASDGPREPLCGLEVAVVGAGPSGVFATQELLRTGAHSVTVIDRLPAPYGLLRYGVAPDHQQMKQLIGSLQQVLTDPRVRFVGGVEVGRDLATTTLRERFDAIVYAAGAPIGRPLGVPGEGLPGVFTSEQFVGWYNAHPDHAVEDQLLHGPCAVVIGGGNVALDVARILLLDPDELVRTDVPDHVLASLRATRFTDVHVVVRRGAKEANFTTKELRELGELPGVGVIVDGSGLPDPSAEPDTRSRIARNLELFAGWAAEPAKPTRARLHFHFGFSVREAVGTDRVASVRLRPTFSETSDTDDDLLLRAQLLVSAVGYRGREIQGIPTDPDSGIVTNVDGRIHRGGRVSLGEYVVGWQARGPSGVIGTSKVDARQVASHLVEDASALRARRPLGTARDPLSVRGLGWAHWERIELAEQALGERRGASSVKLFTWTSLRSATP